MPSGLAWLAGLGAGLSGLGQSLEQKNALDQQKALVAEQQRRQAATDALNRLVTLQSIGGVQLPDAVDPQQAVAQATQANAMRSGGAIPNEALGIPDDSVPDAYGKPSTIDLPGADGKPVHILLDPSKSPQAMAERRQSLQQAAMDRRQQAQINAAQALETQKENAKTLAEVQQARANYQTLKALNPKHPLVQQPFDPNNAPNYGTALTFEQQRQLQASAYHPPVSEGDWAPSGAIDKTTGEPILFNKKTGARMVMAGAAPKPSGTGKTADAKTQSYVALMQQSLPVMEALSDKVRPDRISMAIKYPTMGNLALNQDEQSYVQAARNFLAGVLHQESGARLSNEQWQIGLQRFFPAAGDTPQTKAAKLAAAKQLMQDRAAMLGTSGEGGGAPSAPATRIDAGPFGDLVPKQRVIP